MEVIEAMNTCNGVCIKEKNDQPSIQNTNRIKNAQLTSLFDLNNTSLWPSRRVQELSRTPQLKVSILSEYKDFQEGLI